MAKPSQSARRQGMGPPAKVSGSTARRRTRANFRSTGTPCSVNWRRGTAASRNARSPATAAGRDAVVEKETGDNSGEVLEENIFLWFIYREESGGVEIRCDKLGKKK